MTIIAWALVAIMAAPLLMFVVECLCGLAPLRHRKAAVDAPPFTVLMPAHDEALGIGASIAAVLHQLRPCDRLLVVADNCTDDTVGIAWRAGAEVVERHNPALRGKGFALDWGRAALRDAPPSVVIVLDADCRPDPGALAKIAAQAAQRNSAVQGAYLISASGEAPPMMQVADFAFLVKNLVRQRGLARLGAPALLQGAGMAFPWAQFEKVTLASDALVEDLEIGLDLVLGGDSVSFADHAGFWSEASTRKAAVSQRTRWEHGYVATIFRYAPRLLVAGLKGRPRLIPLAIDQLIPPLALLVLVTLGMCGLVGLLAIVTSDFAPFFTLMSLLALLGLTIMLTWYRAGRQCLRFRTLLHIPLYMLWKLPIYLKLVFAPQRAWVRTSREPDA